MSNRKEHLFQFSARDISEAARAEAEYHEKRAAYWEEEMDEALGIVAKTAAVKVAKQAITGGWRPEVVVDYGDPAAYARMQEGAHKIQAHQAAAETFRTHERLYGTQSDGLSVNSVSRVYELDSEDVLFYRLGGGVQEE